ncbi:MAG: hypothetical protein GX597_13330 [Anaerolineaceae bacterium]|nr:hypothetical protein [Anaerolineaceae bacterium]
MTTWRVIWRAAAILPILPEIDRNIEDTAAQANKGWWHLGDPRDAA